MRSILFKYYCAALGAAYGINFLNIFLFTSHDGASSEMSQGQALGVFAVFLVQIIIAPVISLPILLAPKSLWESPTVRLLLYFSASLLVAIAVTIRFINSDDRIDWYAIFCCWIFFAAQFVCYRKMMANNKGLLGA